MKKPVDNDEINSAFDDIFLAEEKITEEEYEKGYKEGRQQGNTEAYHLGYHRGAEIGAELGFYLGVIKFHLNQPNLSDKVKSLITCLAERIENFPKFNDSETDIIQVVTEIRSQYRRLCSALKFKCAYPEASNLSF